MFGVGQMIITMIIIMIIVIINNHIALSQYHMSYNSNLKIDI